MKLPNLLLKKKRLKKLKKFLLRLPITINENTSLDSNRQHLARQESELELILTKLYKSSLKTILTLKVESWKQLRKKSQRRRLKKLLRTILIKKF